MCFLLFLDTIDEDLVDSIVVPATDPAAAEVFYRINSSRAPGVTINQLLKQMKEAHLPLLLLWGDLDPWITPSRVSGQKGIPARGSKRVFGTPLLRGPIAGKSVNSTTCISSASPKVTVPVSSLH